MDPLPHDAHPRVDAALLVAQVADQAIVALDPDGRVASWNAGAERLTGRPAQEALGRAYSTLWRDGSDDRQLTDLLARAAAEGSAQHRDWLPRRDDTELWGQAVLTALRDPDGVLLGYALVISDHTRDYARELALRRSEQRMRLLVEQVVDYAIIGLDADGRIERWNSGAQRLKGYRPEEVLGQHFSIFYTTEDRAAGLPLQLLERARRFGSTEHSGWRVRRDGTRFWGDVVITALHDEGELVGYAKVTRDLTARKRFDDARTTFFDIFAHDFRGPVTALSGFADLLTTADREQQRVYVERIRTNARRLVAMTDDLIEHSRVQSAAEDLRLTALDLQEVARTTVAGLPDDDLVARVRLDVPPVRVLGDRGSVERVLVNLLANALRYSTGDTSVVVATTVADGLVSLTVTDEGRGIDAGDLSSIFGEFERGRLATADGGSGLGLTSVKLLVERMGGDVSIASTPGTGTTVTVTLAQAPAERDT